MTEEIVKRSTVVEFLRTHPATKTFTESELIRFCGLMELESLNQGAVVVEENEVSRDLYFIVEGEVSLLKWDEKKEHRFSVGTLGKGDIFGEMSFLDGVPRAVAVETTTPTIVLKLPYEKTTQADREMEEIHYKVDSNISFINMDRLRQTTQNYVQSLRWQVDQLNLQNNAGRFFMISIILMGMAGLVDTLTLKYGINPVSPLYDWSYLLVILVPLLLFMPSFGCSLSDAGVTWKNARQSLIEGSIVSGAVIGLVVSAYYLYRVIHPALPPLLEGVRSPSHEWTLFHWLYLPQAYLQEFVARGVMQGTLKKFWADASYAGIIAITVVAFMFAIAHVQRGLLVAFVVFLGGLIFGWLYNRHQNLLGVGLVHYVLGTLFAEYLDLV